MVDWEEESEDERGETVRGEGSREDVACQIPVNFHQALGIFGL